VTVALSPDQYFGFLIALLLIFGVSFELPLLVVMLNQVGVLPAANLRRWNRGIIFGFFVFAAFVIPGGDGVSMTILAIALTVLFEGALLVAMAHDKKHARLVAAQGLEGLDDDEASPLNLDTAPLTRRIRSRDPGTTPTPPESPGGDRGEGGVGDHVGEVTAGAGVELPAAGDQLQGTGAVCGVDLLGGELVFRVGRHRGDSEVGDRTVGEHHLDLVAGLQGTEPVEHRRALVGVDVAEDDRRAGLAGGSSKPEPAGLGKVGGHLDGLVGIEAQGGQRHRHTDRGDAQRDWRDWRD